MKDWIFSIVFLLACSTTAWSQKESITASADKNKILIGEQITLSVQATVPQNAAPAWLKIDSIAHFEILSKSKIDSSLNGTQLQLQQTYTITSWDSGQWQLPSFHLSNSNKTKPIPVQVSFSPVDPKEDYHDIKDILELPAEARTTWYWYLIIAGLLVLVFMLVFPRQKKKGEADTATDDAYKQAMAGLHKLSSQRFEDAKDYYTQLVNIFRTYLQKKKGIQSFSKTTDDIVVQIKGLNLPSESYPGLVQALRLSDMVKFAKFSPNPTENKAALQTIKESIHSIENLK